ncbi:type IV secretion system protein (plasmid) [Photobacterium leiognathi subsp. mandapamensis]|uniref:type IV secretion system protein n=1 Tax=Photobacterium leiognathi TaxID=553611 RepID=UPI003AF3D069
MTIAKSLLLIILLTSSASASAFGVPTFDVAAIAQMVKEATTQAEQFRQQMASIKAQIEEAKKHNGVWGDIGGLTNSYANNYLKGSSLDAQLNGAIAGLRDQFDLKSDNPDIQRRYDGILKDYAFQETIYKNAQEREKHISDLIEKLAQAETPAQKSSIEASLLSQQLQMQNEAKLIANRQAMIKQQQEIEHQRYLKERENNRLRDNF